MPAVGTTRLALVACATACALAHAQNPPLPDTGRLQEPLRVPEPPRAKPAPSIRIETPRFEAVKPTPPFYVARFTISGETAFSEAELLPLVGEPRRELTLAQVQELAERITDYYRAHGYIVARALIPAQDVRDGVVRIEVVEGRYGRIDIANATEMSETLIRRILDGVKEGALVHGPTLERAVLLLADRAGIQPRATLEPGEQPGTTNLTLEIAPGPATEFDALIDNGGARATGRTRVTGDAVLDSPRNVGDRLSARGITSGNGLLSGRLAYETPLGVKGVTGVAYVTQTTYQLGAPFEALDATGTARTLGGSLSYPLVRSSAWNLRVQAGAEARELEDKIGALSEVNKRNASVVQWGASADARDNFLAGATSSAQFLVTNGELDLKSDTAAALDAATARTAGGYAKVGYGFSRLQALAERTRLSLMLTGQRAFDNLDSSEKFAVGGLNGVRAYPVGEAAGDDVQLFQAELRVLGPQIGPGQLVPLGFLDWAHSRINHDPWAGFTGPNDRHLWGYGVGAEWSTKGRLFARLWYARKGGDEAATADTDRRDRLWGQAGVLF